MSAASREQARAARRVAALFRLGQRGVVAVSGRDARRWLNGMVSNDVASLSADSPNQHCHALLLTRQGRITADLHVIARPEGFWLELERDAVAGVLERLAKHVIADDVALCDASGAVARLALEGPAAPAIADAAGDELAAAGALVVSYGVSGEPARQVFAPTREAERVYQALVRAGRERGLVEAGPEALEILRIEAGTPRQGRELSEEVLPQEAGLDDAISTSKGCYTGQEVVARVRTYGQVKHRLVGLRVDGGDPPAPGTRLEVEGARVGEVTSATLSPHAGAIALGYVRRPHDEPDTILRAGNARVRVARLPLVEPCV